MRNVLEGAVVALLLLSTILLNGRGPILGARKELANITIGPVRIRLGYIK